VAVNSWIRSCLYIYLHIACSMQSFSLFLCITMCHTKS